jgi:hypothetical protein
LDQIPAWSSFSWHFFRQLTAFHRNSFPWGLGETCSQHPCTVISSSFLTSLGSTIGSAAVLCAGFEYEMRLDQIPVLRVASREAAWSAREVPPWAPAGQWPSSLFFCPPQAPLSAPFAPVIDWKSASARISDPGGHLKEQISYTSDPRATSIAAAAAAAAAADIPPVPAKAGQGLSPLLG